MRVHWSVASSRRLPAIVAAAVLLLCSTPAISSQPTAPSLGSAASFAVLGGASVNNSGPTVVTGNLGVSPGHTVTGFGPGTVVLGSIRNDLAPQAQTDAVAAYAVLAGQSATRDLPLGPFSSKTAFPGTFVYHVLPQAQLSGTLVLDAGGDVNTVWIFQAASLTTASDFTVLVTNGGWNGNVFWQVDGSATLGDRTSFIGNLIVRNNITLQSGASVSGRLLALTGSVTLNNNKASLCCDPINLSPPTLPKATLGVAYFPTTITASGGKSPYTFTIAEGSLPPGLNPLTPGGALSGTPTKAGTFPFTVTATDSQGCQGSRSYVIDVVGCQTTITVTNPGTTTGTAGTPFSQTFAQRGAQGTATFTTASTLPTGFTLSTAGVLSGTTNQHNSFPIVVTVTDSNGCTGTSATYTLIISCQTITVTNPSSSSIAAGTPLPPASFTFTQSGSIGGATFTTASTLPTGVSLTSAGVLTGTPTQGGSFPIVVTVTDGNGCTGINSPPYTLTITCPTITVTNPGVSSGTAGVAFSQTFTQNGGQGTITWSIFSGTLPTGMTLHSGTGILDGTPTVTSCFPITVKVTDANGCTAIGPIYILCIICQTITVTNPIVTTGTVNVPFSQTFTQSGAIGGATFSLNSGSLPAGLTLSAGGVLSGTPTQSGSFPITVKVTDGNLCTGIGATYPLIINPGGCVLTLSPATLPSASPGTPYSEVITASGGSGSYTFVSLGSLPPGLIFMPTTPTTATISGIPTTVGCFTFNVTATDVSDNTCFARIDYTICVAVGGPTLSVWGMVVLSVLLAGAGMVVLRKGSLE